MVHLLLAVIYIAFISLGLPDAMLGSAWPSMYGILGVSVSFAGMISMIIALSTVVSSLQSDRLTRWLGTEKVTTLSVGITAVALFGFSVSNSFITLCLWAIPYGLGAGGVDAALNNYVAVHFSSRHMSWLHCSWGVGASLGPYVMGHALTGELGWNMGYRYIAYLQIALTALLLLSLPLWKRRTNAAGDPLSEPSGKALSLRAVLRLAGAKEIMVTFFCYQALEKTVELWGSSYLALQRGISPAIAARFASLFVIGITIGRAIGGFLSMTLSDRSMVRLGQGLVLAGIVTLLLPGNATLAYAGLVLIGLGCAPIYPSILHATPARFGADKSQAIIGIQMAFAFAGNCLMPPLFGLIAKYISISVFPIYLLAVLALMVVMHESPRGMKSKHSTEQALH